MLKLERVNNDCVMQNSSLVNNHPLQGQTKNCARNKELNSSNCLNYLSRHIERISFQKDFTSLTYKNAKIMWTLTIMNFSKKNLDTLISSRNKNSLVAHLSYRQNLQKNAHGAYAQRDDVDQECISLSDDSGASSHLRISLAGEFSISSSFKQRDEWDTTRIALCRNVKDITSSTKVVVAVLVNVVCKHQFPANKDLQGHEFATCPKDPILHGHFGHNFTSRNVSKQGKLAKHKAYVSVSLGT